MALHTFKSKATLFQANELNEVFNRVWFPTPLQWNGVRKKWEYKRQIANIFFASSICLKIAALFLFSVAAVIGFQNPEMCSDKKLLGFTFHFVIILTLVHIDYLLVSCGNELALANNWCYQQNEWFEKFGLVKFHKLSSSLSNCIAILPVIYAAILAVVDWYTDINPIMVTFMYLKVNPLIIQASSIPTLVFALYFGQVLIISFRTICLTATQEGLYRMELLKGLHHQKPTFKNIMFYVEINVVTQIVSYLDRVLTGFALGNLAVVLIVTTNVFLLMYRKWMISLMAICIMITLMALSILHWLFLLGCSYYKSSEVIRKRWSKKISLSGTCFGRGYKNYLKRKINSLQNVYMPAGDFGKLDKEVKVNFIGKLLSYISDSIIATRSLA